MDYDLTCPICQGVFFRPVVTTCGHHFCQACLSVWLQWPSSVAGATACPLCRSELSKKKPYQADVAFEQRAIALLGPTAYRARELDAVEVKLVPKVEAYRRRQLRLSNGGGLVSVGLGAAAISSSVAVGLGAAAFVGGLKVAAWLDDQGRYCLMEDVERRLVDDRCVRHSIHVVNFLTEVVIARVYAARKKRREPSLAGGLIDAFAVASGLRVEDGKETTQWQLERSGEALVVHRIPPGQESELMLPLGAPSRLLLKVSLPGFLLDSDLGASGARRGRHFLVAEATTAAVSEATARQVSRAGQPRPSLTRSLSFPCSVASSRVDAQVAALRSGSARGTAGAAGATGAAGAASSTWSRTVWRGPREARGSQRSSKASHV